MITSVNNIGEQVAATAVHFSDNMMHVSLSDGRIITVPLNQIPWLTWLAQASAEQRTNWTLEPGGFAIYWEELEDGFEIEHLLATQSLA